MTRWVVLFGDTPGVLAHRRAFGAEHIAYLEGHADRVLVGGVLRPVPGAPFVDGMWIVEAETHDEVVELVLNDPHFNSDHRRFRILAWGKAIDRQVVL
jgi:uncharacterized protein YciI